MWSIIWLVYLTRISFYQVHSIDTLLWAILWLCYITMLPTSLRFSSAVKAHQFFTEESWDIFKQILDTYMFEASKVLLYNVLYFCFFVIFVFVFFYFC